MPFHFALCRVGCWVKLNLCRSEKKRGEGLSFPSAPPLILQNQSEMAREVSRGVEIVSLLSQTPIFVSRDSHFYAQFHYSAQAPLPPKSHRKTHSPHICIALAHKDQVVLLHLRLSYVTNWPLVLHLSFERTTIFR